jgi:anaerobic magnesium-protoporphyrin IX monomethyl ester cyclase
MVPFREVTRVSGTGRRTSGPDRPGGAEAAARPPGPAGRGLRVTLVNPPSASAGAGTSQIAIPPLGLAYVAASLLRAGHSVDLVDGVGEWIEQRRLVRDPLGTLRMHGGAPEEIVARIGRDTEIIGVSCPFSHAWPSTRALLRAIRARFPRTPLVLGGEHASALPELALLEGEADVVVVGEGEAGVVEVCAALRRGLGLDRVPGLALRVGGEVRTSPRRPPIAAVDSIPWPAWALVPIPAYLELGEYHGARRGTPMPMLATRGCPSRCTFCSAPQMWTPGWRPRSPRDVVDEMARYREDHGADDFHFEDLSILGRRAWVHQLCDEIARRQWDDVTWQIPCGTRWQGLDAETARRLRRSGCTNITLAPESGSRAVLRRQRKQADPERLLGAVRDLRRAGLSVDCFLMLGFPDETPRELLQTLALIVRLVAAGADGLSIATFVPIPGTTAAEELRRRGLLRYDDAFFRRLPFACDLLSATSWNPGFSDAALAALRLAGHGLFYSAAFAVRPWRALRVIRNCATGRQETKVERTLQELGRTLRLALGARPGGGWLDFWSRAHARYVRQPHVAAHAARVGRDLVPHLGAGARDVLDWGCGSGLTAPVLTARGVRVSLHDRAPAADAWLRRRFAGAERVSVLDERQLAALPDGSFDLVLMHSVLQYLSHAELRRALPEVRRLLRPGGRLVLGDVVPPDAARLDDLRVLLRSAVEQRCLVPTVAGLVAMCAAGFPLLPPWPALRAYADEEVAALLGAAGLDCRRLPANLGFCAHRRAYLATRPRPGDPRAERPRLPLQALPVA